jgi:hypothetical protein
VLNYCLVLFVLIEILSNIPKHIGHWCTGTVYHFWHIGPQWSPLHSERIRFRCLGSLCSLPCRHIVWSKPVYRIPDRDWVQRSKDVGTCDQILDLKIGKMNDSTNYNNNN